MPIYLVRRAMFQQSIGSYFRLLGVTTVRLNEYATLLSCHIIRKVSWCSSIFIKQLRDLLETFACKVGTRRCGVAPRLHISFSSGSVLTCRRLRVAVSFSVPAFLGALFQFKSLVPCSLETSYSPRFFMYSSWVYFGYEARTSWLVARGHKKHFRPVKEKREIFSGKNGKLILTIWRRPEW